MPSSGSSFKNFSFLDSFLPAGIGPAVKGESAGIKVSKSIFDQKWSGLDLSQIEIAQYHLLERKAQGQVLLKSPRGYPLLICSKNSPICVSAFSLGIEDSNLAAQPALFAFLRLVFQKIAGPIEAPASYQLSVGDPIKKKWGKDSPAPEIVLLKTPDGKRIKLHVKNRSIFFPETNMPGIYELDAGTRQRFFYAVNVNRKLKESDLAPENNPPWKLLGVHSWPEEFLRDLKGQNERPLILFLVLAFFARKCSYPQEKRKAPPPRPSSP